MIVKVLTVLIIFVSNLELCQSKTYRNYSLYNLVPEEAAHMQFLLNIDMNKYVDVMFWKRPHKLFEDVQLIVNPKDKDLFLERAQHFKMNVKLLLADVQGAFDNQTNENYNALRKGIFTWDAYHDLEDIYRWLTDVSTKHLDIVNRKTIGHSTEGREILAIFIGRNMHSNKPRVIVEGGIHGNEWLSVEFVLYLINELVSYYQGHNTTTIDLIDKYHWYVVPVVNPDGFSYSHKQVWGPLLNMSRMPGVLMYLLAYFSTTFVYPLQDRLWRKNRRHFETGVVGVDLNRNFGYSFGKYESSKDPNDDFFCGRTAFSEPETRALSDFITDKKDNLKFYFSIHCYGQKIIIPYGDRIKHIDNYNEMENYGIQAVLRMHKVNRVRYNVGTTYDTLSHRISGNTASWVKKHFSVPYVFTFLLRDDGTYGHALPPDQIKPACEETMTGLLELMTAQLKHVRLNFRTSSSSRAVGSEILVLIYFINFRLINTWLV